MSVFIRYRYKVNAVREYPSFRSTNGAYLEDTRVPRISRHTSKFVKSELFFNCGVSNLELVGSSSRISAVIASASACQIEVRDVAFDSPIKRL